MSHSTPDGWVTYYRVAHPTTGRPLLIQKRDGETRTVDAAYQSPKGQS